jgi:hypothetical protein
MPRKKIHNQTRGIYPRNQTNPKHGQNRPPTAVFAMLGEFEIKRNQTGEAFTFEKTGQTFD